MKFNSERQQLVVVGFTVSVHTMAHPSLTTVISLAFLLPFLDGVYSSLKVQLRTAGLRETEPNHRAG